MSIARTKHAVAVRTPIFGLLVLLLANTTAMATTDSLLENGQYPATRWQKPIKPFVPVQLDSGNEALMYQMTVDRYNKDAQAYTDCVNTYLATATADVARIQAQMDAAVAIANAP